jgi:hypothetical protein
LEYSRQAPYCPQNARRRVVKITRIRALICPVLAVLADGQYHAGLLKFFE